MQTSAVRACSYTAECSLSYAKIMQGESNGKTGKPCFTGFDTAEPQLSLCKDNANECSESLLLHCRVQLSLCKGRMNIHAKFVVSYKIT